MDAYRAGLLGEVRALIDLTEAAAKRAADIATTGVERYNLAR